MLIVETFMQTQIKNEKFHASFSFITHENFISKEDEI